MKQKVAFINAFPSDTFLREFNFADYFYTFSEIIFAIDQEVCFFSFQSAVYFAILKIRIIIHALINSQRVELVKNKST